MWKMEENKFLERYGKFYNEITKLSKIPLEREPSLGDLDVSKTAMMMGYRDIKELNLEGGILDYLCFLSTENFLRNWLVDYQKFIKIQGKADLIQILSINLVASNETNNVLRIVFKNPRYFFGSSFYAELNKIEVLDYKKVFRILMDYRFDLYKNSIS
jgi:hypothetical protein